MRIKNTKYIYNCKIKGWPAVVAIMGNWFGKNGRGLIFGIWSATASFGNIIGALMVASVLKYGYHVIIIV